MAEFNPAYSLTSKHEGGYVNDPIDRGGETYAGITRKNFPEWNGWAVIDRLCPKRGAIIPELSKLVCEFYYDNFWGRIGEFTSQAIANYTYDWRVHSGNKAIKVLQKQVGVADDGILGKGTIAAVNACNEAELLSRLKVARIAFYHAIVANDPTQAKYINGWVNRAESVG